MAALRRAAGRWHQSKQLRRTAANLRHGGMVAEDEVADRAIRLLLAAVSSDGCSGPARSPFELGWSGRDQVQVCTD